MARTTLEPRVGFTLMARQLGAGRVYGIAGNLLLGVWRLDRSRQSVGGGTMLC
jgi:hypothetical protein